MSFVDKQLTCRDCGNSFLFTGGEQEFYANKGLQNEPVRCPPCRSSRKSTRLNEPEDGYVKYGVFASFGGRTPRQMHPATCADCGMMTEVPFQPRGDRPVYCSACYSKIKGAQEAEAEAAETATISAKSASDGPHVDLTPEERKLAETLLGTPAASGDGEASAEDFENASPDSSDEDSGETDDAASGEAAEEPAEVEAPSASADDEADDEAPSASADDDASGEAAEEPAEVEAPSAIADDEADDEAPSASTEDDASDDAEPAEAEAPSATADDEADDEAPAASADDDASDAAEPAEAEAPSASGDEDETDGATEEEAKLEPIEAAADS